MSIHPSEKYDHSPAMELESSTSMNHDTICRDGHSQYAQNAYDSWGTVPKRKPVPAPSATAAMGTELATPATTDKEHIQSSAYHKKRNWPLLGLAGFSFKSQKRSRKIIIIAILAIVLIALIIGLAVGLTVGRYAILCNAIQLIRCNDILTA